MLGETLNWFAGQWGYSGQPYHLATPLFRRAVRILKCGVTLKYSNKNLMYSSAIWIESRALVICLRFEFLLSFSLSLAFLQFKSQNAPRWPLTPDNCSSRTTTSPQCAPKSTTNEISLTVRALFHFSFSSTLCSSLHLCLTQASLC